MYDIVDLEYGMGAAGGELGSWDWDGLVWELGGWGGIIVMDRLGVWIVR